MTWFIGMSDADISTQTLAYTVDAAYEARITVEFTNRSTSASATASLWVVPSGEGVANEHLKESGTTLGLAGTPQAVLTRRVIAPAGAKIYVQASSANVSCQLSGDVVSPDNTESALTTAITAATTFAAAGTGATDRTIQNKMRDIVSVKDFGATGDGTTDDTAAIQAAITASYGKALYFPSATYLISFGLTITDGITLHGDGFDSIIKVDSAATRFLPVLVQNLTTPIVGFAMRDMAINGNLKCQLDAGMLQINNATDFIVDHVRIYNGGTPGESASQGVNGIGVSAGALDNVGSQGSITNCIVEATTKGGINWTTQAINGYIAGNIVRNCTGNGSAPGIQLNGGFNATVIGNHVYGNQGPGIYIATVGTTPEYGSRHAIIANNHCYSNGTNGIEWANGYSTYYGRIIIAHNQSYSNGVGGVTGSGFLIQNDTHGIIQGNYAYNNFYSGFSLSGSTSSTDLTLVDNVAENNNQAAIASGSGYYISGTTLTRYRLINNKAIDTQGSPTHKYGLNIDGSPTLASLYIRGMECVGSVNTPQINIGSTVVFNNIDVELKYENTTTDATVTNTAYFVIPDLAAISYRAKIIAKKSGGGDRALYDKEMLAYRSGGGATLQGAVVSYASIESDATWNADVAVTGNYVTAQVTGKAATTISWIIDMKAKSL